MAFEGSASRKRMPPWEGLVGNQITEQEAHEHNNSIDSPIAVVPLGVINRWIAEGVCTRDMISRIYISTSSPTAHQGYCIVSL